MKKLTLVRIAAAAGIALSLSSPAMADENDGVTCRAGTTAVQNSNHTNLKCSFKKLETRETNCLTLANGVNGLQQKVQTGPDLCTDPTSRANAGAPKPVLLPGDPTTGWVRQDTPGGRDVFVQTVTKYEFPRGAVFNPLDNASRGVSCPSNYPDGGSLNGGRSIRCETAIRVAADCDSGWTLRVDDQGRTQDKCIGLTGVGLTKPKGITNVVYQAQRGQWKPVVQDGADKFRHFGYPTSRN